MGSGYLNKFDIFDLKFRNDGFIPDEIIDRLYFTGQAFFNFS
jgi:hypothetical protein